MKRLKTYISEDFKLNKKGKISRTLNYQPKDVQELRTLLKELINKRGKDADLNDIDVSQIKSMNYMYDPQTKGLFKMLDPHNIDISEWDVSNVEDMSFMFAGCENFNCDLSRWNVSKVKYMTRTFLKCTKFTATDLHNWDIRNVEKINGMFCRCKSFDGKEVENWNIANGKLKSLARMFMGCENLNCNLSKWDVSNIEDMHGIFKRCPSFEGKGLENWDVSNVADAYEMFYECTNLQADLSNWNIQNINDMEDMFTNCKKLNCDFKKWKLKNDEVYFRNMFDGCDSLVYSNWPDWYNK